MIKSGKKIMNPKIINIIFALVIVALVCCLLNTCGNASKYKNMINASNDTLATYVNQKGQHVATIAALQGTVADLKHLNAGKDSALLRLQQLVDKHTASATVHGTVTGNIFNSPTEIKYDTIKGKGDTVLQHPTYVTRYENKWEKFRIIATPDSFDVDYKVFNEYDYQVRYNKKKWYKSRVPEIIVTNINPHTETLELKTYMVAPPKHQKKIVFLGGLISGIATSVATGYFVSHLTTH